MPRPVPGCRERSGTEQSGLDRPTRVPGRRRLLAVSEPARACGPVRIDIGAAPLPGWIDCAGLCGPEARAHPAEEATAPVVGGVKTVQEP